jgi:hypothetical protein
MRLTSGVQAARLRHRFATVAIVLFIASALGQAQAPSSDTEQLVARAEAAFACGVETKTRLLESRKHFSTATDAYLELHRRGLRSAKLYANLGNAAMLADRWPEAIWAYNVGLLLDPNDRTLREHLAIARAKILYPPSGQGRLEPDLWPIWLHRPTEGEILWLRYVVYVGLCLAVSFLFHIRNLRYFLLVASLFLLTAALLFASWHLRHQAELEHQTPLVILTANADFHRGNGPSYPRHPVVPVLPRGLEMRQTHRRGNWLHVRLTTGETGWIHASQALIVEP